LPPPQPRRRDNDETDVEKDESAGDPYLDGNRTIDRPLFVQFCSNDPDALLAAARRVAPYCDAVDINFGCPQGIARRGRYGAFLQEDQDLVYRLINTLHRELPIPVTAKIRILDTREATLAYARNVLAAGASILTVHGRRREQKGHITGLADWATIRWLREQLPAETVLFANGNVLQHRDLQRCLDATGADGVMSAEGNLSDAAIFATPPSEEEVAADEGLRREYWRGSVAGDAGGESSRVVGGWRVDGMMRRYLDILHRYVAGVDPPPRRPLFIPGDDETWLAETEQLERDEAAGPPPPRKHSKRDKAPIVGSPNMVAVQGHLFHLLRHLVTRHTDVRDRLGKTRQDLDQYERILAMVETRVARGLLAYERTGGASLREEAEADARAAAAKAEARRLREAAETKAAETKAGEGRKPAEAKSDGVAGGNKRKAEDEPDGARAKRSQPEAAAADETTIPTAEAPTTAAASSSSDDPDSSAAAVTRCRRPWWVAQPIVRPLPQEALAKGSIQLSKRERQVVEDKGAEGADKIVGTAQAGAADGLAAEQADALVAG
jgi:tRNA-dihydrouridine synthase 1